MQFKPDSLQKKYFRINSKNNRGLFLTILLFSFIRTFAAPVDTIWTIYQDGEFTTQCVRSFNVPNQIVSDISDYLVSDFHDNPENLFNWALKDLGLQNKKNELIIAFVSSVNDNKTGITHGVFDVIVPNFTTFKGIKVDAKVSKTSYKNGLIKVNADIAYSTLLLDRALGVFTFVPQKNNEQIFIANVKIKFGWFFNLFMTKKRYKNIVEWRVKKFADNMKKECLSRKAN